MYDGQTHENDALLWANMSNDTSDDSSGYKAMLMSDPREEKEKGKGSFKETNKGERLKGKKSKVGESSNHGKHKYTETERRKKMRKMFSELQNMLP